MDTKNKLLKNTIFLYILTFSNYFIGLLIYPYLSRVLSVEKFGLVGFSMSFVAIFQAIIEFGFMISATAEISKYRDDKEKLSQIFSTTMLAKTLLIGISIILFLLASIFVDMLKQNFLVVFLFLLSSIATAMLPDFFFRGIEQMKTITMRTVSVRLLSLLLIVLLVKNDSQVIFVPIGFLIGNLISFIISITIILKMGIKFIFVRHSIKDALLSIKTTTLFFLSRIAISINSSLGSFFLGLNYLPQSIEVGLFSGASKLSSACEMLSTPVADSVYPYTTNKKDYKFYKKIFIYGMISWCVIIIIGFICSNLICKIVLGDEYIEAGNYLKILLVGSFFSFPNIMLGYPALSPIGKAKHANIAYLISTSISVMACLILWAIHSVNLTNICIVIAMSNFISLIYRGSMFYKNRKLIKNI